MDLITSATAAEENERQATVALLPIGSFEQHGEFLPLATDTLIACIITDRIAAEYPVMLLPPITISCSHEHAGWRGTVSISARTLYSVVTDIAQSLAASGVHRLVLVNGHGGNYVLSNVVQEATIHEPVMALFPSGPAWNLARSEAGLETDAHDDMHGGELETSILLHAKPDVVRPGNESADWLAGDRRHLLTLGMGEYTKSGIIGKPSAGTAAKGSDVLASLARSFADVYAVLTAGS